MTGTLINVISIVIGSLIGLMFHRKFPVKITDIVFQVIGLFTLYLGISMALKGEYLLIIIFSLILGAIVGTILDIDEKFERLTGLIQKISKSNNKKFSEGFATAFLLFCMGSMTILGAFEEGLGGEPNLLLAKSLLDGFSSIALSAGLGIGVLFSVIPLLIYQGGLTLLAGSLETILKEPIINEMTATGGILLLGLGINILKIKELKIINMLPAIVIVVILSIIFI